MHCGTSFENLFPICLEVYLYNDQRYALPIFELSPWRISNQTVSPSIICLSYENVHSLDFWIMKLFWWVETVWRFFTLGALRSVTFFSIKSKKRRLKDERSNGRLQGKVISHETEHTDPLRLDDKWISTSEDWSCWYLNSKYPYNFAQFFVPFSPLQIAFLSLYTHLPKYLMDDEIRSCVENSIFQTFFCINNHSFNRLNHNDNLKIQNAN